MVTRSGWMVLALCSAIALPGLGYQSSQAVCWKTEENVIIDGNLTEWETSSPVVVDNAGQLVRDETIWKGPLDFSGQIYLMWDEDNLYIAAEMLDDVPFVERQGMGIHLFDSIELYLCTAPTSDPMRETYESTDFRVLLSMVADAWPWETYVDRHMVADKLGLESGPLTDYEREWSDRLGGYTFEARIPLANFVGGDLPEFLPTTGMVVGFNVVINDVDVWCPLQPSPSMAWCGDERSGESPDRWGTLRFEAAE
jgi:hypothetical protein